MGVVVVMVVMVVMVIVMLVVVINPPQELNNDALIKIWKIYSVSKFFAVFYYILFCLSHGSVNSRT